MLFFLLLFSFLSSPSPAKSQSTLPHKLKIFILAGQSNMAGRGGVINETWDGVVPPQCQPNPSILRFTSDLEWVLAREPLHSDIDAAKVSGIGPGLAFANAILTRNPSFGTIGLVPCAVGGTNISEWKKGGSLYQQLVKRASMAANSGGVIAAMLWYQGESDTVNRGDAELYKGRLENFFTDLRSDLDTQSLPIYQVALASGKGPYISIVRKAQMEIDLQNVQCVDAQGLPREPDGLHLTAPAQVRLGEKLADAFLQSITPPSSRLSSNAGWSNVSGFLDYLLIVALWMMNLAFR